MKAAEKKESKPLALKKSALEIAEEESEKIRLELEETHKKKVHKFCLPVDVPNGDFCIGYLLEPNFEVKKMAADMGITRSITGAGELILDSCIIKEKSDPRIYDEDSGEKYPMIRMGAIMKAQTLVGYFLDAFKKK
jgi:hypothetical protein